MQSNVNERQNNEVRILLSGTSCYNGLILHTRRGAFWSAWKTLTSALFTLTWIYTNAALFFFFNLKGPIFSLWNLKRHVSGQQLSRDVLSVIFSDYDAPLSEAGNYTPKYHLLRTVFSQYHSELLLLFVLFFSLIKCHQTFTWQKPMVWNYSIEIHQQELLSVFVNNHY